MANGGWYGTKEEWERIESPLFSIDPIINSFAIKNEFTVRKNFKDNPDRSIEFQVLDVRCLIQVWITNQETLAFDLWFCASRDLDGKRYWKKENPIVEKQIVDFKDNLASILADAHTKLLDWSKNTDQLEFITNLGG